MRLLLVGAFAHPHAQGSQAYFQEQAIALRAAGAEIHLLTYGPGKTHRELPTEDDARESAVVDAERRQTLDGIPHTTLPAWAAPTSRRSGPHSGKPLADLGLALALRKTLRSSDESSPASSSASSSPFAAASVHSSNAFRIAPMGAPGSPRNSGAASFDAILAHHAEAAVVALRARPRHHPPIIYCAHTLLEEELPEYFKPSRFKEYLESSTTGVGRDGASGGASDEADDFVSRRPFRGRLLASLGRVIDHGIARRCDGWIALTQASSRVISSVNDAPGRRIGPPIRDPALASESLDSAEVARALGLVPGGFFLYAGNLDPYQDLPLLERLARARGPRESARRRGGESCSGRLPVVIATHDERASDLAARVAAAGGSDLRVHRLRSTAEVQALVAAARACLVPRRTVGGFPIKLANSLAAGVPVVALHGEEWGIEDGRDSLIGDLAAPVHSFARALERLESDPALAARLGAGARATYLARLQSDRVAAETLDLIETVLARH